MRAWNRISKNWKRILKTENNMEQPFVIERMLNAPVDKVWKAISDGKEMQKWYFNLPDFRAEVGYEFQFNGGPPEKQYLHLCKVTEAVKEKRLSYTWRYDGYPGNSEVTFELFPEGNKTRIKLTHKGLESFAVSKNPHLDKKNFEAGWTDIIGRMLPEFLAK
jgi:uncharacterized protein YndB with AHSA1/START domain